jgi:hypothetical protein
MVEQHLRFRPHQSPNIGRLVWASWFVTILCSSGGCAPAPTAVSAGSAAIRFGADFMLGKLADGVWDAATGKPDIYELNRRLKRIEDEMACKGDGCAVPIRNLRQKLTADMTEGEYLALAYTAQQELERRVKALEHAVDRNTQDIRELQEKHASDAPDEQDFDQLNRLDRILERNDAALRRN